MAQEGTTDAPVTRHEQKLKENKLALEIKELKIKMYLTPAAVLVAFVGVGGQYLIGSYKNERTLLEVAQLRNEGERVKEATANAQRLLDQIKKQQDDKSKELKALQQEQARLATIKAGLESAVNELRKAIPISAPATAQTRGVLNRTANARFLIDGIYGFRIEEADHAKVMKVLTELGYTVGHEGSIAKDTWPETFPVATSSILYYDSRNQGRAAQIAKQLQEATGHSFGVFRGAGFGVKGGTEAFTFNVYYMPIRR